MFSLIPTFESRHSQNPASLSEQAVKDYRPNSDRMNLEMNLGETFLLTQIQHNQMTLVRAVSSSIITVAFW
ncbi:hypothetical protein H6G97_42330 [Nostoc flagelliforme FACHB-838]|uniref:Uncharacterized protein n=1 Tax=Nostoc flagelliforme FACHB-838 TaxID=2692904 RepID=A0ABR8E1R4_9NOSO|nr:hypothetical protein [Nostoc flagelliforme FACHB-838]